MVPRDHNLPVLSIVMELGVQNPQQLAVVTDDIMLTSTRELPYRKAYWVVFYGATSETYRVINKEDQAFVGVLLGPTPRFEGITDEHVLAGLRRLKPAFEPGPEYMDWATPL